MHHHSPHEILCPSCLVTASCYRWGEYVPPPRRLWTWHIICTKLWPIKHDVHFWALGVKRYQEFIPSLLLLFPPHHHVLVLMVCAFGLHFRRKMHSLSEPNPWGEGELRLPFSLNVMWVRNRPLLQKPLRLWGCLFHSLSSKSKSRLRSLRTRPPLLHPSDLNPSAQWKAEAHPDSSMPTSTWHFPDLTSFDGKVIYFMSEGEDSTQIWTWPGNGWRGAFPLSYALFKPSQSTKSSTFSFLVFADFSLLLKFQALHRHFFLVTINSQIKFLPVEKKQLF